MKMKRILPFFLALVLTLQVTSYAEITAGGEMPGDTAGSEIEGQLPDIGGLVEENNEPDNLPELDDVTDPDDGLDPGDVTDPDDSLDPGDATDPDDGLDPGDVTDPDDGLDPGDATDPDDGLGTGIEIETPEPPPSLSNPSYVPIYASAGYLPCIVPEYCDNTDCQCKVDGLETCVCDDDCLCKTVVLNDFCQFPGRCDNEDCLCGELNNKYLCICDKDCACCRPIITLNTTTIINAAENKLKSGEAAKLTVLAGMISTEATFSGVIYKTYIKGPLELVDNDPDLGGQFTVNVDYIESGDYAGYTCVEVRSSSAVTGAATYNFEIRFPSGVTPDGLAADCFTIIEGNINSGNETWEIKETDNVYTGASVKSVAASEWSITLENKPLDYKDPENEGDTLFLVNVSLDRTPANTDAGVLYLQKADMAVTIKLPGEAGDLKQIARIVAGGKVLKEGEEYDYTYNPADNTITITSASIFNGSFSGNPSVSSADHGEFYVVFELTDEFLDKHEPKELEDGFYYYEGLAVDGQFTHRLATEDKLYEPKADKPLELIVYVPGSGGGGNIDKWATPFIDGVDFFNADKSTKSLIAYHINYTNTSNTPLIDLTLSDVRPEMRTLLPGGTTEKTQGVDLDSVYFHSFTLNSVSNEFIRPVLGNTSPQYKLELFGTDLNETGELEFVWINPGDTVVFDNSYAQDIDEIRLCIIGVVLHGFNVSATVDVTGDSALSNAANKDKRNKINFVKNTATYFAKSEKDDTKQVGHGDSFSVHVYPFENEPDKVWTLKVDASRDNSAYSRTGVTVSPLRDVYYKITVTPRDNEQFIYQPVFYLQLPPDIRLKDENEIGGNLSFGGSASGIGLKGTLINNPVGSGRLLRIECDSIQLLNPSNSATITVHCAVSGDALRGAPIAAKAYFGIKDLKTQLDFESGSCGSYINNFDSTFTAKYLLDAEASITVTGSGLLEGELYVQTEFDRGTEIWRRHPEVAKSLPGGLLTYKFIVRNGGDKAAENIVLYNVFSHMSDSFLIGNGSRSSQWKPYLAGPVTPPDDATVYYSEYDDHKVTVDGVYSGTADWTEHPYNWQSVKAIKIVFDEGYKLNGGDEIEIYVPMYAPVEYVFDPAPGPDKDLAISSLGTQFNFEGTDIFTQALEPLKVTVQMVTNQKGEISGVVWNDSIKNGIKDTLGSAEFPVPDVKIYLLKKDIDGDFIFDPAKNQYALTDNDGGYKFTNLDEGDYRLLLKLPEGYSGTDVQGENVFSSYANDTGYVYCDFTIDYSNGDTNRLLKEKDAGLYAEPGKISGTVWRSIDGLTERDEDETDKDAGINGVTVLLYRIKSGSERDLIKTTETKEITYDGEYAFDNLAPGRYIVVFELPQNHTFVPRMAPPSTIGKPGELSKPGESGEPIKPGVYTGKSQALPRPIDGKPQPGGLVDGQSYEIYLDVGETQVGIDAGIKPDKGTISGYVYGDFNGTGAVYSPGSGLENRTVELYKTGGSWTDDPNIYISATTDANGYYVFSNLTPGTYKVEFTCDSGEYISSLDNVFKPEDDRETTGSGKTHNIENLAVDPMANSKLAPITGKNFGVVKKITVSGLVYNDKDADGKWLTGQDANHEKLLCDTVTVARTGVGSGQIAYAKNYSTTDGAYITDDLWPGSYTVTYADGSVKSSSGAAADANGTLFDDYLVTTEDNANGFVRGSRTYTLNNLTWSVGNTAYTGKDLALTRPRAISGIVWHDRDGNGEITTDIQDLVEECLNRSITISGEGILKTIDTANSLETLIGDVVYNYLYKGLYPGTYTITVTLSDGTNPSYLITNVLDGGPSAAGEYTVVVPALDEGLAKDKNGIDFGLAKPVSITGKVWLDAIGSDYTLDGVYADTQDKLLDITNIAKLYKVVGGSDIEITANGAGNAINGAYSFTGLLPGSYKVALTPNVGKIKANYTYFITGPFANTVANITASGNAGYTFRDYGLSNNAEETDCVGTWSNIILYSDDDIENINLSVGRYAIINGVIWHDMNGNGIKDDDDVEGNLESAETLTLERENTPGTFVSPGTNYASANSFATSDGNYSFKVKPGLYRVTFKQGGRRITNIVEAGSGFEFNDGAVSDESYARWTVKYEAYQGADDTIIAFPDRDFLLSAFASISGIVWIDKNADAVMNTAVGIEESALAGDVVTLTYEPPLGLEGTWLWTWYNTWFDSYVSSNNNKQIISSDAAYTFDNLWPGRYTVTLSYTNVSVSISDYILTNVNETPVSTVTDNPWELKIPVNSTKGITADFGVVKPSGFAGSVWHDADGDGINGGESYISSIKLEREAVPANGRIYVKTINAAAESGFDFTGLLPGTYTVTLTDINEYTLRTNPGDDADVGFSDSSGSAAFSKKGTDNKSYTLTITDATGDGIKVTGANLGFARPSTVSSVVYYDNNNNGIRNQGEGPVAGVTAELKRWTNADGGKYEDFSAVTITANSNGVFTCSGLFPGKYQLAFTGVPVTGVVITTLDGKKVIVGDSTAVFSQTGKTWDITIPTDGKNISLETGVLWYGSISGTVWKDINGDGVNSGESGYDGLAVKLYVGNNPDFDTATPVYTTTTNGSGAYTFDILVPGAYTVVVEQPGSWYFTNTAAVTTIYTRVNTKTVTIQPPADNVPHTVSGVDFGLTQLVKLSGRVWIDKDPTGANGIYNENTDEPVDNKSVIIKGLDSYCDYVTPGSIQTDSYGEYIVNNLWPGRYEINFPSDTYPEMVLTNAVTSLSGTGGSAALNLAGYTWSVTGNSGYEQANVDFALSQKSEITGLVWRDIDANGLQDADKRPDATGDELGFKDIVIRIYKSNDGGVTYTNELTGTAGLTTDNDGKYSLSGLDIGFYKVVVAPQEGWGVTNTASYAAEIKVQVSALGLTYDNIDFGLAKYVEISGHIWTENDDDGKYGAAGNFSAAVPGHSLVEGHAVTITRTNGIGSPQIINLTTGANGLYAITATEKVFPGSFDIVISNMTGYNVTYRDEEFTHSSFKWDTLTIYSEDAPVAGKDCSFSPIRGITGKVWHDLNGDGSLGAGDDYLESFTVTLQKKNVSTGLYENFRTVTTGADGVFTFTDLPHGEYKALVTDTGQLGVAVMDYLRTNPEDGISKNNMSLYYRFGSDADSIPADPTIGLTLPVTISGSIWVDDGANGGNGIKDNDDSPVTGSFVYIEGLDSWCDFVNTQGSAAVTDGMYEFSGLMPGAYKISFTDTNYRAYNITNAFTDYFGSDGDVSFDDNDRNWNVTRLSGGTWNTANFGLIKRAVIEGAVWHDIDANGVRDADKRPDKTGDEPGLPGVKIDIYSIEDEDGANPVLLTNTSFVTGANGAYILDDLDAGWYKIVVTAGNGWGVTNPSSDTTPDVRIIRIEELGTTQTVDFGLAQYVEISGLVWTENDGDGVYSTLIGGDAPVIEHEVYVTVTRGGVETGLTLKTGSNGKYAITATDKILPGMFNVSFDAVTNHLVSYRDDDFDHNSRTWDSFTLYSGDAPASGKDCSFTPARGITGVIWHDYNGDGIKDNESFMTGLEVTLTMKNNQGGYDEVVVGYTDENGTFTFNNLLPGDYRVAVTDVSAAGYVRSNPKDTQRSYEKYLEYSFGGAADSAMSGKTLGLTKLMTLSGKIWIDRDDLGANGTYENTDDLIENTYIAINGLDDYNDYYDIAPLTELTVANGDYIIDGLWPGRYEISFIDGVYADMALTNAVMNLSENEGLAALSLAGRTWSVTGNSGYVQTGIDFALSPLSEIKGLVWHDTDANGLRDTDKRVAGTQTEQGLDDIEIKVYMSDDGGDTYGVELTDTVMVKTNGDGEYSMSGLGVGFYKVVVIPPAGWGVTNTANNVAELFIEVEYLGLTYDNLDFGLAAYVRLSGRVWTEDDGKGVYSDDVGHVLVSGHPVEITWSNGDKEHVYDCATDQDGYYAITAADKVLPGDFTVVFGEYPDLFVSYRAAGFSPADRKWSFTLYSEDIAVDKDCSFTSTRDITGVVWHDYNGNGVFEAPADTVMAGVIVELYRTNASGGYDRILTTVTDIDGAFMFAELSPGDYRVVLANGSAGNYLRTNPESGQTYADKFLDYRFGADELLPSDTTFGLTLPVKISGFAFIDKDSDGTYAPGTDDPVQVPVSVNFVSSGGVIMSDITAADGRYGCDGYILMPGVYTVSFQPLAGHSVSTGHKEFNPNSLSWTVTLYSGDAADYLDIGYKSALYKLTGYVWIDANGNAVINDGELPFTAADGAVTVTAYSALFGQKSVNAGDNGRFEIMVDGPGEYTLSAALPQGYVITNRVENYNARNGTFRAALTYDAPVSHTDIGAARAVSVSGRLFWDDNADGIQQENELPLANRMIRLVDANGYIEAEVMTDDDGNYNIDNLKPGVYTVMLPSMSQSFFTGYYGDASQPFGVCSFDDHTGEWVLTVASEDINNVSSGYFTPSRISGFLYDKTGDSVLPGYEVGLYKKNSDGVFELWLTAVTDENGEYVFSSLTYGEYEIRVNIPFEYSKSEDSDGVQNDNTIIIAVNIPGMDKGVQVQTIIEAPDSGGGKDHPGGSVPGEDKTDNDGYPESTPGSGGGTVSVVNTEPAVKTSQESESNSGETDASIAAGSGGDGVSGVGSANEAERLGAVITPDAASGGSNAAPDENNAIEADNTSNDVSNAGIIGNSGDADADNGGINTDADTTDGREPGSMENHAVGSVPKTGDESNTAALVVIALIALALLTAAIAYLRKLTRKRTPK